MLMAKKFPAKNNTSRNAMHPGSKDVKKMSSLSLEIVADRKANIIAPETAIS